MEQDDEHSAAARQRFADVAGKPLFFCDWTRALFIHFEIPPACLQSQVPYRLDTRDGKACVSLVAFTIEKLRPRLGGALAHWALAPIACHRFLNVRTYVRHEGEAGIYFLLEWLNNRLAVLLGPATFGLPYRFGHLDYRHDLQRGNFSGEIRSGSASGTIRYTARCAPAAACAVCPRGSLDEWLLERYVAFTRRGRQPLCFRIWHQPWAQVRLDARLEDATLLHETCPWFKAATLCGANFSAGVHDVWISFPHQLGSFATSRIQHPPPGVLTHER